MASRTRKTITTAVKILVAVALLGWVLGRVHWRDYVTVTVDGTEQTYAVVASDVDSDGHRHADRIVSGMLWWQSAAMPVPEAAGPIRLGLFSSLEEIRLLRLSLGVLGFGLALLVSAWRLWFLLKVQEIRIRLWEVIRLTYLGQFFNSVVPGTVGGDLVKAFYIAKHTPKNASVLISVFIDRILGLTGLSIMAAIMVSVVLLGGLKTFEEVKYSVLAVAVLAAGLVLGLTFLLSSRFRRALRLQKIYSRLPLAAHFAAAGEATRLLSHNIPALIKAVWVTMVAQTIWIGSVAMIGWSLSIPTAWYNYFVYTPLIYIIGAVPVSPGGVGLVEAMFVEFFMRAGGAMREEPIVAMAILARAIQIFWGLPGILVVITGTKVPKTESMNAAFELDEPAPAGEQPDGHCPKTDPPAD